MKKIFGIVLSAALLAGCAKEMSEKVALGFTPKDFTASLEATKTDLGTDGHSVLWSTGDRIGVFYKQKNVLVAYGLYGNGGKTTGYFMATDGDNGYPQENEALMYYAIYPFDANATQKEGILTVTLPNTQSASIGFDPNAAVMAAKSNIESLEFQNTEGLLKLVLKHEIDGAENVTVSKIVLTSNSHPLSGLATINAGTDFKAVVDAKGSKTITFNCSNPEPIRIYDNQDTAFHIVVPETAFEADDLMVSVYFSVSYGDRSSEMSTSFVVPQAFNVKQNEITTITKSINVSAASITGKIDFDDSMPAELRYKFRDFGLSQPTVVTGTTSSGKDIKLEVVSVDDSGKAIFRVAEGSYSPSVADGDVVYSFIGEISGISQKYTASASVSPEDKSLSLSFTSQTAVVCVSNWGGSASGKSIKAVEVAGPRAMTVDGVSTGSNDFYRTFDASNGPVYLAVQDPIFNPINKIVLVDSDGNAYYYNPDSSVTLNPAELTTYNMTLFSAAPSISYSVNSNAQDGSGWQHNDGGVNDSGFATNGVSLYNFRISQAGQMVWVVGESNGHFCSIPTPEDGDVTFAFRPGNETRIEMTENGVSLQPYATEQTEALYQANSILVSEPVTVSSNKLIVTFNINEGQIKVKSWKLNGTTAADGISRIISRAIVRGYIAEQSASGAGLVKKADGLYGNYRVTVGNDHKVSNEEIVEGYQYFPNGYKEDPSPYEYEQGTVYVHHFNFDYDIPCNFGDVLWIIIPTARTYYPRLVNVVTAVDIKSPSDGWYRYEVPNGGWEAATGTCLDLTGADFKKIN